MNELFKEWYLIYKEEIKQEYIAVNKQRYGYGQHYTKWENSFKEYVGERLSKEEQWELVREGGKEEYWIINSALIRQGQEDGYNKIISE